MKPSDIDGRTFFVEKQLAQDRRCPVDGSALPLHLLKKSFYLFSLLFRIKAQFWLDCRFIHC